MKLTKATPYVETHGNAGSDVVMIHGWGMHSGVWRSFAKALAYRHRVTLIDLPGHGRSGIIDDFSLQGISAYLLSVAPFKAHWIGWSLGAKIGLYVASKYPDRVYSLTMMAGNARFSKADSWPCAMDLELLSQFAHDMMNNYHRTMMQFLSLQTWGLDNSKEILKELKAAVTECGEPDVKALMAGLDILRISDLRETLRQLEAPLLIILGERDKLAPPSAGEAMKSLAQHAQVLVLEGASHTPFLSHAETCLVSLERFWEAEECGFAA